MDLLGKKQPKNFKKSLISQGILAVTNAPIQKFETFAICLGSTQYIDFQIACEILIPMPIR